MFFPFFNNINYSNKTVAVPSNSDPLNPQIKKVTESTLSIFLNDSILSWLVGSIGGVASTAFTQFTIHRVVLHELVGHIYLGFYLTTNYSKGVKPHYEVTPSPFFSETNKFFKRSNWDQFLEICFCKLPSGVAYSGKGRLNLIGVMMGKEGRSAWISLAGSVPELVLTTAMSIGGVSMSYRSPMLGGFMVVFALVNHLFHCIYPVTAVWMDNETLIATAKKGHDFANFAVQTGKITGLSPKLMARVTAVTFIVSVPLATIAYYLATKPAKETG